MVITNPMNQWPNQLLKVACHFTAKIFRIHILCVSRQWITYALVTSVETPSSHRDPSSQIPN